MQNSQSYLKNKLLQRLDQIHGSGNTAIFVVFSSGYFGIFPHSD